MDLIPNSTINYEFATGKLARPCEVCLEQNAKRQPSHQLTEKPSAINAKVTSDLVGPIKPTAINGSKYLITFLNAATRYLEFSLLKTKSEAFSAYKSFEAKASTQTGKRIQVFKTDRGGEYVNREFSRYLDNQGTIYETTGAAYSEQNGLAKVVNRVIFAKVRALLANAKVLLYLWLEAYETAIFLYNRTPHTALSGKTPYKLHYNTKLDLSYIKIFGSILYFRRSEQLRKLEPRASKGLLVGFSRVNNFYKVYNLKSRRLLQSRDVRIIEGLYNSNRDTRTLESIIVD